MKAATYSIIIAAIGGLICGIVIGTIIGRTTFSYQELPVVKHPPHYISFPEELFQAKKGDKLYLRESHDTTIVEFYNLNQYHDQNNIESIRTMTDSVFYPTYIIQQL
jgi:hypothetical protein